jgi:hypothetical protein
VEVRLAAKEAEELHALLERALEEGHATPALERTYRTLGWRILAAREDAPGLTGRLVALAKRAGNVEEYESTRDRELGPILDGLENSGNRDP